MDHILPIFLLTNILVGFVNAGVNRKIANHGALEDSYSNNPPSGCDKRLYCTNKSTIFQRGNIENLLATNFDKFLRLYADTVAYKSPKNSTLPKDTSENVPCDISIDFQLVTYAQTFPYGWAPLVQEPNYFQYFRIEHCSNKNECNDLCNVGSCNPRATKCRTITNRQPVLVWQGDKVVSATAILPESCKCAKKKLVSTTPVPSSPESATAFSSNEATPTIFSSDSETNFGNLDKETEAETLYKATTTTSPLLNKRISKQKDQQRETKLEKYGDEVSSSPRSNAKTTILPGVDWKNSLLDNENFRFPFPFQRNLGNPGKEFANKIVSKVNKQKQLDQQTTSKRAKYGGKSQTSLTPANDELSQFKNTPVKDAYQGLKRNKPTTILPDSEIKVADFGKSTTENCSKEFASTTIALPDPEISLDTYGQKSATELPKKSTKAEPSLLDNKRKQTDEQMMTKLSKYDEASTSPRFRIRLDAKMTTVRSVFDEEKNPLLNDVYAGVKRRKSTIIPTPTPASPVYETSSQPMTKSSMSKDGSRKKKVCPCKLKNAKLRKTSPGLENPLVNNAYQEFKGSKSTTVLPDSEINVTNLDQEFTTKTISKGKKRKQFDQQMTAKLEGYGMTTQTPLIKRFSTSRFSARWSAKTTTLANIEFDQRETPLKNDAYQGLKRSKSTTMSSDFETNMANLDKESTTKATTRKASYPFGNKGKQLDQQTTTKLVKYGKTTQKPWMPLTKYVSTSPRFSNAKSTTSLVNISFDESKSLLEDTYQGIGNRRKSWRKSTPVSSVYKTSTTEPMIKSPTANDDTADEDCPCRS